MTVRLGCHSSWESGDQRGRANLFSVSWSSRKWGKQLALYLGKLAHSFPFPFPCLLILLSLSAMPRCRRGNLHASAHVMYTHQLAEWLTVLSKFVNLRPSAFCHACCLSHTRDRGLHLSCVSLLCSPSHSLGHIMHHMHVMWYVVFAS